jgi:hypothetical protein
MISVWPFSFSLKMHWMGRFGEIKYGLATFFAKTMPKLAE